MELVKVKKPWLPESRLSSVMVSFWLPHEVKR